MVSEGVHRADEAGVGKRICPETVAFLSEDAVCGRYECDFSAETARGGDETDKYKDIISRLRYDRNFKDDKIEFGAGFSYHWGGHAHFSNINTVTDQFYIFQGIVLA